MKRLHVNVSVEDIERSVAFYATLFGSEPTVRKADYAKWMLDDPRVNFAISARGRRVGLDHLGIQAETPEELSTIAARLASAGESLLSQEDTVCCYARSDKAWVTDPSGIAWESFFTRGAETVYGEDTDVEGELAGTESCCAPGASTCGAAAAPAENERETAGAGCC